MNRRSGGTRGSEDDSTIVYLRTYDPVSSSNIPFQTNPTNQVAVPSSTQTTFLSTQTTFASASHSMNEAPPAITSTITIHGLTPTPQAQGMRASNKSAWEKMGRGIQGGIIGAVAVAVIAIIFMLGWFGCRGKARWRKASHERGVLPLHTTQQTQFQRSRTNEEEVRMDAPDAPPHYDEVIPPHHQRLAGGNSNTREEEEASLVADGKIPLSEIPFEDMVLEPTHSTTSSDGSFSTRHPTTL